jgi:cation transport ATPase
LENRLEKWGVWYSRFVIASTLALIPALALCGVPILGGAGGQPGAVYRAMGYLTAASPCALVMVPLAYTSALFALSGR